MTQACWASFLVQIHNPLTKNLGTRLLGFQNFLGLRLEVFSEDFKVFRNNFTGQGGSPVECSVCVHKVMSLHLDPSSHSVNTTLPDFDLTVTPLPSNTTCQVWPTPHYSYTILIGWWMNPGHFDMRKYISSLYR